MPKIDARKASQDFYNRHDGKRIYCHKKGNVYSVGVNGTSQHYGGLSRDDAAAKINHIQNLTGFY